MSSPKLPIIELYKALQGEGSLRGRVSVLLRFTGCTHRCYFGNNNWCDTPYSSITPEKGRFTFDEVARFFRGEARDISQLVLTGGSPTMHPKILQQIITLFHETHPTRAFITLETEGSHTFLSTPKIDLISLSPKLSNSVPSLGVRTPQGQLVDEKLIAQHNKYRLQYSVMRELICAHKDYQIKIVVDEKDTQIWQEIDTLQNALCVRREKIWLMPAGASLAMMQKNYAYLLRECVARGFNFTGRDHVIAFGDRRGV